MTTTRVEFDGLLADHRVVPVARTLFADSETPVGLYRKLAHGRPGTFLLESAEQGGIFSRYSFIGVRSFGVLTQDGEHSVWMDSGLSAERAFGSEPLGQPLADLARLHARWAGRQIDGFPPLTGGLVGFIGWEAIRQIEHLPSPPPAEFDVPGQALCFVAELIAIDHRTGLVHVIASVLNDGPDAAALWADAQQRLDALEAALRAPATPAVSEEYHLAEPDAVARSSTEEFVAVVERSKTHIVDGDVFQVVISQRFDAPCTADPLDVYRVLRNLNPSPYMYLVQLERPGGGEYTIVGSSPEALVKVTAGRAHMHPIAGSRPRGNGPEADLALETELLADPKERAEHLMLVDLARNDLAKVCQPGSVEVTEFMRIERFSHIMHIVSTVEGEVRPDATLIDIFTATFPAGTLSGAPKPRALEIIDELEPAQRGVYGGVVGYFDFAGNADLAIAIRTAVIADQIARVQAGAGLVADSDPSAEDREAHAKAAAVLRAIATANQLGLGQ